MRQNKKSGFIGSIIVVIAAIVLLKLWFDFDVIAWLKQPEIKRVFTDIWEVIVWIWNSYLKSPSQTAFRVLHDLITKNF